MRTLALLLLCAVPAGAAPAAKPPAVLFAGSYGGGCAYDVAGRLNKAGFNLDDSPGLEGNPLTWERVSHYNVLVITGLGRSNADMTLSEKNRQSIETLRRFLDAGGGVLFVPVFGQMATEKPAQDAFLKPLGLTPLFAEMPFDPENSAVATPWKLTYALTRNVAPSPVTEGVKALWYPTPASRVGGQNHTVSFSADANWTVLLKGSRTSFTRGGPLQANAPADPGTYASDVPLVATRQVGKGRILCLGIAPQYLFDRCATTTLEGIVLDRGLRGVPSDGYRLVENALRWLAEPSLAEGTLGGAPMKTAMLDDPSKTKFGTPYAWPAKLQFPAVEPAYPGCIGARSTFSSGKASPEAWVKAAKAKGLAYLVFLEEFRSLTADGFEKLKAECARLSSRDFAAIPGFAIDDEIGNHYFYCGTTCPYPDRKFLSPDGKVFRSRDAEIDPKNPYVKGQLAMTTLDFAYSLGSFKLTAGNYLFHRSAAPFGNWFSNWDALGVITAENGRVVEDDTREYLQNVDFGNGPLPLVIDLMDDPAQLGRSGWRTVLRLPEKGGAVIGDEALGAETKIRDYFNGWRFYPDNPAKISITSGPDIESWGYTGPRDYEGNSPGDFVWQNYRWVLHARITSAVGLKEVTITDGEEPFRRYLPAGKREFELELDLAHDKQHNLVITATDTAGGRAISGEQWDRNHRLEEFMCSDRNNQLSYGYLTNKEGVGLLLGGNQTLATPNKRLMPGISPAGTFKNDGLLGAPAFDGAAGGEPEVFETVQPLGTQAAAPDVTEARRLFHTGDVHVGEGTRARRFSDNVGVYNVWHTLWKTEPAPDYAVTRRNHFFQVNPDSPLAVFLWQIDVTLQRDLPNKGFLVGVLQTREDTLWALRGSDGMVYSGNWEETPASAQREIRLPFGKGAYAALLDSPLGGAAVYSLTDGLEVSMGLPGRSRPTFELPAALAPQKKGETKRVELLLLGIPRLTPGTRMLPAASTEVVERFFHDFALDGGPGGYTVDALAGKVAGRRYLLDIDGGQEQCFSGKLAGNLISSLPIRVAGLNDRWSCVLYDRARKQARPVGAFEGKAWATVCLSGSLDLFLGHPVVADNPKLAIQATQTGESAWHVEIHNPTDAPIRAAIRPNPHFDPLKGRPAETLDVPAGTSVWREW